MKGTEQRLISWMETTRQQVTALSWQWSADWEVKQFCKSSQCWGGRSIRVPADYYSVAPTRLVAWSSHLYSQWTCDASFKCTLLTSNNSVVSIMLLTGGSYKPYFLCWSRPRVHWKSYSPLCWGQCEHYIVSVHITRIKMRETENSKLFIFQLRKENSMVWGHERTIPTERPPLVGEVIANFFVDRWCHVVSVTDSYGRILSFLDRSRYFSIK
jgi:hypothetical protein